MNPIPVVGRINKAREQASRVDEAGGANIIPPTLRGVVIQRLFERCDDCQLGRHRNCGACRDDHFHRYGQRVGDDRVGRHRLVRHWVCSHFVLNERVARKRSKTRKLKVGGGRLSRDAGFIVERLEKNGNAHCPGRGNTLLQDDRVGLKAILVIAETQCPAAEFALTAETFTSLPLKFVTVMFGLHRMFIAANPLFAMLPWTSFGPS